jgi:WD40 repeat protein
LTGTTEGNIVVWDLETKQSVRTLTGHEGIVWDVTFAPGSNTALSAGKDKTVRVWDLESGEARVLLGNADEVHAVKTTPDGKSVVSASMDGAIRVWDLQSGIATKNKYERT